MKSPGDAPWFEIIFYRVSIIGSLVAYIHNRDLKEIKSGIQSVDDKVTHHSDRISKIEEKTANLDDKHRECLDDRSHIHSRITRSQGGV